MGKAKKRVNGKSGKRESEASGLGWLRYSLTPRTLRLREGGFNLRAHTSFRALAALCAVACFAVVSVFVPLSPNTQSHSSPFATRHPLADHELGGGHEDPLHAEGGFHTHGHSGGHRDEHGGEEEIPDPNHEHLDDVAICRSVLEHMLEAERELYKSGTPQDFEKELEEREQAYDKVRKKSDCFEGFGPTSNEALKSYFKHVKEIMHIRRALNGLKEKLKDRAFEEALEHDKDREAQLTPQSDEGGEPRLDEEKHGGVGGAEERLEEDQKLTPQPDEGGEPHQQHDKSEQVLNAEEELAKERGFDPNAEERRDQDPTQSGVGGTDADEGHESLGTETKKGDEDYGHHGFDQSVGGKEGQRRE